MVSGIRAVQFQKPRCNAGKIAGFSLVFRQLYRIMELSEWFSFHSYVLRLLCFV